MGKIYKVTNKINGNIYIGQTRQPINTRWLNHCYSAETSSHKDYSCPLHNAIRKYGRDNFLIEEIEDCDNDLLNEREQYWIQFYNSYNNGYNAALGGDGHTKYDYNKIVDYFLNHENNLLATCQEFNIYDQVVYTALHSKNIDYKALKNTKPKHKYNKWILLVEHDLVFKHITDIDLYLHKSRAHGNIRRRLNGITEKAYGYHWKEIEENADLANFGYTLFSSASVSV